MQIQIRTHPGLAGHQLRAYAEYRVFAALARFGRAVSDVTVRLETSEDARGGLVACLIDVDLGEDRSVRSRASARQPTDAVDDAADRMRRALDRRFPQTVSS